MKNMILYVSDEEATAIETLLSDTEDRDGITAQERDSQEHQGAIRHPEIQEHAIRIQNALSDMRNALGRHNVTVYTDDDAYNPVKAVAAQMQRLMVRMHTAHDRIDREIRELNVKAQDIDNGEPRDPHEWPTYIPLWTEPEEDAKQTARNIKDKNRVNRMNQKDILILLSTQETATVRFDEQYRDYDETDNGYTEDHMKYIAKMTTLTHKLRALVHGIDTQTEGDHE